MKRQTWMCVLLAAVLLATAGRLVVWPTAAAQSLPQPGPAVNTVFDPVPRGNVLRFGMPVTDVGRLDPHLAAGSQDRALADMVFNGLLRYAPGDAPKLEPDLAADIPLFEMVGGRQVWTVHLRRGVMFHAGPMTDAYELTADDVVFSLRKSADPAHCAYAGEYDGMTFEKVDAYTIRIILEKPLSSILFLPKLTDYAGGFIVSKRAVEAMGMEAHRIHPVGTGPFAFKMRIPNEKIMLSAHRHYFRGRPELQGVEIHFSSGIEKLEADLLRGDLDVIMGSGDKEWIEKMETVGDVVIDTHGVGEVISLYLNTQFKPLHDVRVRRAIAYAIDREAFLSISHPRLVGSACSQVPVQFLPGGLTPSDVARLDLLYPLNLEKARTLLADAGYPDGFTMDLVASEKRLHRGCFALIVEQLAKIGIDCRITFVPHGAMHRLIRQGLQPMVLYTAWRPNADAYLSRFFHSDAIVVTGSHPDTNFSHYRQIDRLIEAARLEIDPEKQINLWGQAQIRILNDMAAYPIMFTKQCYARKRYVDYGHELSSTMALYPQFTEKTRMTARR